MNPSALVSAAGAGRTFGSRPDALVAVQNVTCEINPGDRIAVTGPSGSGKTTLVHLLVGLDEPTTGTIMWPALGGRDDLRPGPISIVFQAPSLMPPLDVRENVELPLLLADVDRTSARKMATAALTHLGLESLATKLPEELSGGQAQRVAVARVLAGRPRLIVADEPTGQLDHANGLEVVNALIAAADATGAALVVNTHDPFIARRFSINWAMRDGRLAITESLPC